MHIPPQTSLETYEVGNKGKGKTKFTGYEDRTRGTSRICLPKNPLSSFSAAKVMLVVENAKRSVFFLRFFKKKREPARKHHKTIFLLLASWQREGGLWAAARAFSLFKKERLVYLLQALV